MGLEMVYAPVMITACNRYDHLQRCIASLQRNGYAKETELYISVDYPWDETYLNDWEKVCGLLRGPIEGFKQVTIYYQESNLGFYENKTFLYKSMTR